MKVDNYVQVELTELEAFNTLYVGKVISLEDVYVDFVEKYNHARAQNADAIPELKKLPEPGAFDSIELFDQANQCQWFMPEDYCSNLVETLYGLCKTPEQTTRVTEELELFIQHNMLDV